MKRQDMMRMETGIICESESEKIKSPANLEIECREGIDKGCGIGVYEAGISAYRCADKPSVVIPYHRCATTVIQPERTPFLGTVEIAVVDTRYGKCHNSDGKVAARHPVESISGSDSYVIARCCICAVAPVIREPLLNTRR